MSKYAALTQFLMSQSRSELPMNFREDEEIIGAELPKSAYRHRPWWANEAKNHVHAKAWLAAGYQTAQVDMEGRKLVFKHTGKPHAGARGMEESQRMFKHEEPKTAAKRHPMIGALKGWLVVEPGYDLTEPAMPEWADMLDEKYGPAKP